jgi:hypothetical protein
MRKENMRNTLSAISLVMLLIGGVVAAQSNGESNSITFDYR